MKVLSHHCFMYRLTNETGHSGSVWRLVSLFNGSVLLSCSNDASVKVWDVAYHKR